MSSEQFDIMQRIQALQEEKGFVFEMDLQLSDSLTEKLDMDSLEILDMCGDLEKEYGVAISNFEVAHWDTVEDVIYSIQSKQ